MAWRQRDRPRDREAQRPAPRAAAGHREGRDLRLAADHRAPGVAPVRAVVSSACALSLDARKTGSKAKSTARPAPTRSSTIAGRPAGELERPAAEHRPVVGDDVPAGDERVVVVEHHAGAHGDRRAGDPGRRPAGGGRRLREPGGAGHGDAPRAPADERPAARDEGGDGGQGRGRERGRRAVGHHQGIVSGERAGGEGRVVDHVDLRAEAREDEARPARAGVGLLGAGDDRGERCGVAEQRQPPPGQRLGRGDHRRRRRRGGGRRRAERAAGQAHEQRARPGVDVGRRGAAGLGALAQQRLDPVLERLGRADEVGAGGQRRRRAGRRGAVRAQAGHRGVGGEPAHRHPFGHQLGHERLGTGSERVAVDARTVDVLQHAARALLAGLREGPGPRLEQRGAMAGDRAQHGLGGREVLADAARVRARDARLEGHPDRSEEQRRGAVAVAGVEQVERPVAGRRVALAPEGGAHRRPDDVALGGERGLGQLVEERLGVGRGEEGRAALLVLVDVGQRRHREQQAQAGLGLGLGQRQPVAVEVEAVGVDARVRLVAVGVLDRGARRRRRGAAAGCGSRGRASRSSAQVGVGPAGLVAVHRARHPHDRGRVAGAARAPGAHRAQPGQGGAQAIRGQGGDDRVAQRPALHAGAGDGGADHRRGARRRRGRRRRPAPRSRAGRRRAGRARRAGGARGGRRSSAGAHSADRQRPPHRAGSTTSLRASPALGATSAPARSSRPTTSPASACQSTAPAASSASASSTSARVW